jgi:hypothetical protein
VYDEQVRVDVLEQHVRADAVGPLSAAGSPRYNEAGNLQHRAGKQVCDITSACLCCFDVACSWLTAPTVKPPACKHCNTRQANMCVINRCVLVLFEHALQLAQCADHEAATLTCEVESGRRHVKLQTHVQVTALHRIALWLSLLAPHLCHTAI